jgi:Zn ribbon nucleic-acid-binding protein
MPETQEVPAALPILMSCPICNSGDAYIERLEHRDVVFVECVNCHVYLADRKAFRHFEYLRGKADASSLTRLAQLADALNSRPPGQAVQLHFDTWQSLLPNEPA